MIQMFLVISFYSVFIVLNTVSLSLIEKMNYLMTKIRERTVVYVGIAERNIHGIEVHGIGRYR